MKLTKSIASGILILGIATAVTGCRWFEDTSKGDLSDFYTDGPGSSSAKTKSGSGLIDPNLQSPNGLNSQDVDPSKTGAGAWGGANAPVADYMEGVGARIPGVEFTPVYFLFDQSSVAKTEEFKVKAVADFLTAHPEAAVVVEGNCDERGTVEYNRGLGEKRALSAKNLLLGFGVEEFRIKTISYGEERPAVPGTGEEIWLRNRRDEFIPVYLKK